MLTEWGAMGTSDARFLVSTKPVYDTKSITASVVATDVASNLCYAIFPAGAEMPFLTSAIGQVGPMAGNATYTFTESQTNLTRPRETPGSNSEQCIEALGLMCKGIHATYAAADYTKFTGSANPTINAALAGSLKMVDPSALVKPVELESPFMLENAIFQALLPSISLEFQFDNSDRVEKLCTLDQIPQAAGGSYLRSNGEPSTRNRFEFPEGYRWKKTGSTDSVNLTALARLRDTVVVPFTPTTAPIGGALVAPTSIHVIMRLSLHGMNIRYANSN